MGSGGGSKWNIMLSTTCHTTQKASTARNGHCIVEFHPVVGERERTIWAVCILQAKTTIARFIGQCLMDDF